MDYLLIIGVIILVGLLYFIYMYNKFIRLKSAVNEAFSMMDVYLKKRWDLIPNLVKCVKEYAKYEKDTLESITALRSTSYNNLDTDEKIISNELIEKDLNKIILLVENYPELKASSNYVDLSQELIRLEDEIAKSRKYYNATVREYNNQIGMFPSNLVAHILGFKEEPMFAITAKEQENVEIDLYDPKN